MWGQEICKKLHRMHHFIGNRKGCNETCIKITLFYAEEFHFSWNKKVLWNMYWNSTNLRGWVYEKICCRNIESFKMCLKFDSTNQKQANTKSDPKRWPCSVSSRGLPFRNLPLVWVCFVSVRGLLWIYPGLALGASLRHRI